MVTSMYRPDIEAMRQHVEHLFGGFLDGCHEGKVELAWTDVTPDMSGRYRLAHARLFGTDELDDLIAEAARLNATPMCNVYIGAALRHPDTPPFGRARDGDAWALTCGYCDLDDDGAALNAKNVYGLDKPTLIVMTGRAPHVRAQLWWRLEEPVTNPDWWPSLLRGIAARLGADRTVVNPSRVMRLAGSIAWPVKEGRTVEMTSIAPLRAPGPAWYAVEHLARVFPPLGAENAPAAVSAPPIHTTNGLGLADRISDGREGYMRNTISACLIEYIGSHGCSPTPQELFDLAWPQYERRVDLTRSGRGADEFRAKCGYTVQRFERGEIRGIETLDKAVEVYRRKQAGRPAEKTAGQQPAAPASDDDGPFRASSLTGTPPPRQWVVDEWIPAGTVTSIYGDGGVGKTLLAQQLLYAAAVGGKWLGFEVPQCRALGLFCEDDKDELHRRHDVIGASLGATIGNHFSDAWLWPRVGFDNLLVTFDRDSRPTMSPLFERTMATVLEHRLGLLILDTAADLFGGNEVIRGQVNYFIKSVCGSYVRRAREAGFVLTVIILAHPSQAGRNSGSGESGSTGWSNAVRSRLYLTRPEEGLPEQRVLTRKKSNYSAAGDDVKLDLVWFQGVIVRQADANSADDKMALESATNQILRKVHSAFESGRPYGGNKGYDNFIGARMVEELSHIDRRIIASALDEIRRKQMIVSDKTSSGDRRGYRLADDVKSELRL